MKFKTVLVGAAFSLASCASTGINTDQLESLDKTTSAQLRLASGDENPGLWSGGPPIVTVRKYTDEACTNEVTIARLRNGIFGGATPKSLNIALNDFHKNAATETYIETGKPVTFLFHLEHQKGSTRIECGALVQTTFQTGKRYELNMIQIPFDDQPLCKVDLNEIVTTPSGSSRKFIKSFDNSAEGVSETCVNAFEKWRWF